MVVMAVMLVVAAFAIPTMTKTMDAYRLRGSLTNVSSMTQKCRMQAVRENKTQELQVFFDGTQVFLYYKDADSATPAMQNTDPKLPLPTQFTIPGNPAGPPLLDGPTMWGSNVPVTNVNVPIYFNSRGMPCLPGAAGPAASVCALTNGFVYYFKYTNAGNTRWAALSISPAGRIQNWFWNGTSWGN